MRITCANRWAIAFVAGLTPTIGCTTVQPVAYPAPVATTAPMQTTTTQPTTAPTAQADVSSGNEQLDQVTAPIALYPDALLAQVLMAATYPDQVVKAAAWSKQHPELKGDEAVKQVCVAAVGSERAIADRVSRRAGDDGAEAGVGEAAR